MQRLPIIRRISSLLRNSRSQSSQTLSIQRNGVGNARLRRFSSIGERDMDASEQSGQQKVEICKHLKYWMIRYIFYQCCEVNSAQVRRFLENLFGFVYPADDIALEEEVEKKAGWFLKLIFIGTAGAVGYQFFPYMGDTLLHQSISLLHVKDPLFKRMGASRLSRFAIDDERRMKVVELGGAQDLLNVLQGAKDDKTRKEALKALVVLSQSDVVAEALHQAGAIPIITSTPNSMEHAEVEMYKSSLLKRFEELKI